MKNRVIKFRIWVPDTKKFFFTPNLQGRRHSNLSERADDTRFEIQIFCKHDVIWEQFTGFLDKNGKEIFEGDIVRDQYKKVGTIRYDEQCGQFLISYGDNEKPIDEDNSLIFGKDWGVNPTGKTVKIIGNIHENPEVLK